MAQPAAAFAKTPNNLACCVSRPERSPGWPCRGAGAADGKGATSSDPPGAAPAPPRAAEGQARSEEMVTKRNQGHGWTSARRRSTTARPPTHNLSVAHPQGRGEPLIRCASRRLRHEKATPWSRSHSPHPGHKRRRPRPTHRGCAPYVSAETPARQDGARARSPQDKSGRTASTRPRRGRVRPPATGSRVGRQRRKGPAGPHLMASATQAKKAGTSVRHSALSTPNTCVARRAPAMHTLILHGAYD